MSLNNLILLQSSNFLFTHGIKQRAFCVRDEYDVIIIIMTVAHYLLNR